MAIEFQDSSIIPSITGGSPLFGFDVISEGVQAKLLGMYRDNIVIDNINRRVIVPRLGDDIIYTSIWKIIINFLNLLCDHFLDFIK